MAAMRLHNGTANRQPHSTALRFGGKEGVEDLIRLPGRQSYAGIHDPNQQLTILAGLGLDGKFARRFLHCLDAIEHQVQQDLLELHAIGSDYWQIACKVGPHRDGISVGLKGRTIIE